MRETEHAIVKKIIDPENKIAKAQIKISGECDKCGAHNLCGVDSDKGFVLDVYNKIDADEGDHVILTYKPGNRIFVSFMVFGLPIIFLILGYFLGYEIGKTENSGILYSLIGLFISFVIIYLFNKSYKSNVKNLPVITIIEEKCETNMQK